MAKVWPLAKVRPLAILLQAKAARGCRALFQDIAHIGATHAVCAAHGRACPVPACNIFVCCASCKDFSRLTPPGQALAGRGPLLLQPSSRGGSAQTFHGMLSYITWARPAIVLFESVEAISDSDAATDVSNLDVVLSEFASRGYECQQMTGEASGYGVPQKRLRLYSVAVLVVANPQFDFLERPVRAVVQTLRALLKVCVRASPCQR